MDMTSVVQSQALQKSDAALVHLQVDVTDCSPHDVLDVIIDTPVERAELIAAHNEKLYGGDFHPMGDMPVQAAPNMPVQKVAAHSQPIGLRAAWVSGNPSSSSSGASQNTAPSSQLPGASQLSGPKGSLKRAGAKPIQLRVLQTMKSIGDVPNQLLDYSLLPVHLFFSDKRHFIRRDFYNWLHIRIWAYSQVINPPENKKVRMIKAEWVIAVEGQYYSIDVDAGSAIQPKVTADEIARLPPPPPKEKRSRTQFSAGGPDKHLHGDALTKPQSNSKGKGNVIRKQRAREAVAQRLIASCADINGKCHISSAVTATDRSLWGEIIWELSLTSFCLEFIDLDRELMKDVYQHKDQRVAAEHEAKIFRMWNSGGVLPMWQEDPLGCDPLSSDKWRDRRDTLKVLVELESVWPSGNDPELVWKDLYWTNSQSFLDLKYRVYLFYARIFHGQYGHLPTMPLSRPASLSSLSTVLFINLNVTIFCLHM
ncbi:hypothetical protein EW146_g7152 [Bondarzewia mesenterica]|uniref:Uncharacterized protein n=1 Tax=Bondarzewia mesenterica TaxID=1095465 RepID=A0A4V3XEB9_9AGAM|nr:hypothetical protein EW146_g7152 [Bondarzewia mesenterica]